MRPSCGLISIMLVTLFSCGTDPKARETHDTVQQEALPATPSGRSATNYSNVDVSPMDMSYFPVDFPKLKMDNHSIASPVARVIYSRPHLGNRRLFPDILRYGEPWRLGANEATELDVYRDVSILGTRVKAGRYNLYCIPRPGDWKVVLNSNLDTWGLKQDSTLDIHRFGIDVTTGHPSQEYFTMEFRKTDTGCELDIAWDDVVGKLPLVF